MTIIGIKAKETNYYTYKDKALYRNVAAGQILDRERATRNAGNYKVYVDSFRDCALPYSKYYLADTRTGKVYEMEITHGVIDNPLGRVVEELKAM